MKSQRPAVIDILTTSIMARNQQPLTQSTWVVTSPSPRKRLYLKLPNVVYATDAMSGTVSIISPLTNTVKFLKAVGDLCRGFSVHDKGKPYKTFNLQSALGLIHNSRVFLEENEQAIYHGVNAHLPKTLNGPQGNVAGKTIDSVRLVEWGLNRLNEVTKQFNYHDTSLPSCMTLDVEHFHSTTHVKSDVMSMLQYCRSFGNCVKENVKKLSAWSALYFTHPRSWYPLPEGSIQF